MVYILLNIRTGETAVLGLNNKYTLGRSRFSHIVLKNRSCSRKHAEIKIENGGATIMDVGSKRGTYVNRKKVYEETKLENGDIIRFGLYNCKYSFIDPKYQTLMDNSVSGNKEIAFKETLRVLNVTLSESYTKECTHYTTESISLDTLKRTQILDTLIDQKPPVTVKFWIEMMKNIQEAREVPNIYRHMPDTESSLKDKGVDIIKAKKKRQILFKNKLCVFFDETLENNMRNLILKCGGDTIQHNNQANFAIILMDEREFNEAIVVTQSQQEEPSLTVTYFIDKLRQNDKIVHEMYEEEVYISILKGYLDTEYEEHEDSPQIIHPAESDPIVIQDDSCDESTSSNSNKKRNQKSVWTTLNRWITPVKKRKTDRNQAEPVPEKNSDEFDISLDLNSDDSNDKQVKTLTLKKKRNENEQCKNSEFDLNLDMSSDNSSEILTTKKKHRTNPLYTDDSETEQISRLIKTSEKRKQKKNGHLPTEIVVVEDSEGKEINSELKDRLNSSGNHNRVERNDTSKKHKEHLEQIGVTRRDPIYTDDSETEDTPELIKTPERHKRKKNGHLPTEIAVIENMEDKEISSDLKNRLNSLVGHDRAERSGTIKKHKEHREQVGATRPDLIYTDDSETEEMPKPTKTPERRKKKKNEDLPIEIVVIEDTEGKGISSELRERLNSSRGRDRAERRDINKKHKEHLGQIGATHPDTLPINSDDSEVEEIPQVTKTSKKRKPEKMGQTSTQIEIENTNNKGLHPQLQERLDLPKSPDKNEKNSTCKRQSQPLGQNHIINNYIARISKIESHKAEPSTSSKSKSGAKKKMLKVNPLARLKNSSTPKTTENKNATINLPQLNKLFKDVEFVPINFNVQFFLTLKVTEQKKSKKISLPPKKRIF